MCGRFAIIKNRKEVKDYLNKNFNINDLPDIIKVPNYNIAPTEHILVITKDENNYHSKAYKWSYQPVNWTDAPLIINIRKESLSNKRIYQNDFKWHRCLIIADSFYEWDLDGQPYRIHLNNKLFTIAGLYHQSLNNNQDLNPTVAIITKKSGPNFDNIHKRIPALLNDDDKNLWLDENSETNTLLELIESFNEELIIYPISKRINNVKNNDKKLIHEVSKEPTLFNF